MNSALRIDNERDKELYILASLAEIEVQMTLGLKIQEIVDETLHGKKNGPTMEPKKQGLDSYVQEKASKSQSRRQSKDRRKGAPRKGRPAPRGAIHFREVENTWETLRRSTRQQ